MCTEYSKKLISEALGMEAVVVLTGRSTGEPKGECRDDWSEVLLLWNGFRPKTFYLGLNRPVASAGQVRMVGTIVERSRGCGPRRPFGRWCLSAHTIREC